MAKDCVALVFFGMGSEHRDSATSLGYFTYLEEDTLSCPLKVRTQTQLWKARSGLKDGTTDSEEGKLTWGCLDGGYPYLGPQKAAPVFIPGEEETGAWLF